MLRLSRMPWTFSWTASTGTRPCSRRATMLPSLLRTRRDDIRKAPRHLMDQPGQVCLQPRATALPDAHTCETQHSSDQPGASPVFLLFGTENCLEMDEHSSSSRSAVWSHSHAPSSQRCIVRTCFVAQHALLSDFCRTSQATWHFSLQGPTSAQDRLLPGISPQTWVPYEEPCPQSGRWRRGHHWCHGRDASACDSLRAQARGHHPQTLRQRCECLGLPPRRLQRIHWIETRLNS